MAEPSLGYAIGLNVKRQDIFAPAAKQLTQNLAAWKADKAQAKREKDADASKFMSEVMRFSPDEFHVKTRPDAYKFFNAKLAKVEALLNNPDGSAMDQLRLLGEIRDGLASFKDQSKGFQDTDQQIRTDARSVPKPIRTFMSTPDLIPTEDQQAMFEIYEVGYDKDSNRVLSTGPKMFDVRAEIAAPTEEAMLAAADPKKLKEAQQFIKMKTGYDPLAFTELTPDKVQYLLSLGNVMERPGALGSIIEELIDKKFSGNDTKFYEFLNAEMNKQKAAATDPTAPLPTAKDIAKKAATQYMLDVHLPLYQAANAKILNLNKTPKPGGPSGETKDRPSTSEVTNEPQINQKGMNALAASGLTMSVEDAVDMYLGKMPTDPETKKKLDKALNGNVFGSMPTIAFQSGTAEVVSLGLEQVNPRKMFYDVNKGKFYLLYDQAVALGGYTEPLTNQVREINPSEMKQLQKSKQGKDLAIWDELAPNLNIVVKGRRVNVPRTEDYIQGRRTSAVAASSAPTGGKKKKVF